MGMGNRILVVDDDADIRRVVRGILDPLAEISEASNGLDALRMAASEKPDLMLLDVDMADIDGLAVLKAAHLLYPDLAIMMLTGKNDLEVAKSALDDGARSYVTKPFDAVVLREEVRRLVAPAAEAGASSGAMPWSVRK
jgi:CheY-like chemotaxis protein